MRTLRWPDQLLAELNGPLRHWALGYAAALVCVFCGFVQEALELLRADLSALKKACRQTNASLLQLREAMPEAVVLSRDVAGLRREMEQQAAKITSIARSVLCSMAQSLLGTWARIFTCLKHTARHAR